MKLRIVGDRLALAKVNMKQFKADFAMTLNREDSLKSNFEVIEKGNFDKEKLFKYVYLSLDWGRIIDFLHDSDKEEMLIKFYKMEFSDKVEWVPDLMSEDGREFIFKQEVKNGFDVFMINSFIPSPDFDIRSYLNSTSYNYGFRRWAPIVDLGRP
jgi:uncharacterized LabA/DUF88 family protein